MSIASETASAVFPTSAERPDADVVIYDGHCRFCQRQIQKLQWWDCQHKLAYLSLHDPEVARRYPDLTHEQMMREMYVVDRQGSRHHGAEALRYLSTRLRRLWWLAPALYFPFSLPLWQWLYRQIASRRYRWGTVDCGEEGCALHRPAKK
ncbi:MAG TPA: DUF393 domain-containing protein [Pirellulales bacterium]|jgi:predicted DCC family thiol-disulfide oxidoreductase YuxK|nr:DUF393 domain-containing protein [Pirellulales bacterium]